MGHGSITGVDMANDFDQFPYYDNLVKDGTLQMSDVWIGAISYFFQNLIGYLSQFGIFLPVLTTAQRNTIQTPQNGQMIYNSDTNTFQGFQNGSWMTFTLT
jgi:hypothetical protein